MIRQLVLAWLAFGLTVPTAWAQVSFSSGMVPTRTALERQGLERGWSGAVPLGAACERVIRVSLSGPMLFVQTNQADFHAIDAETGRYLWGLNLGRGLADASPAAVNSDQVFVANGLDLFCLDRRSGHPIWKAALDSTASSPPVAADEERVVVGLETGKVVAYTARDRTAAKPPGFSAGHILWAWKTMNRVSGRPIPADRIVAFASQDGRVYAALLRRELAERAVLLWRYRTGGPISASMGTLGNRTLLIPSEDNSLYAIDLYTAQSRWVFPTDAPIRQEPLVARGQVYVLNQEGMLSSLDPETGRSRWTIPIGQSQVVAVGLDRLYLLTADRDLVILDRATGRTLESAASTYERAGLNLRDFQLAMTNRENDRLYLATTAGFLICLRERGRTRPVSLRDPNEPPFGFLPESEQPIPPAHLPAGGPKPNPSATAPAPGAAEPAPAPDAAVPGGEVPPPGGGGAPNTLP